MKYGFKDRGEIMIYNFARYKLKSLCWPAPGIGLGLLTIRFMGAILVPFSLSMTILAET